eukprot:755846-Hanusia_phi.AAC.1
MLSFTLLPSSHDDGWFALGVKMSEEINAGTGFCFERANRDQNCMSLYMTDGIKTWKRELNVGGTLQLQFIGSVLFLAEFLSLREVNTPVQEKDWADIVCCSLTGRYHEQDGRFFIQSEKNQILEDLKTGVQVHEHRDAILCIEWKQRFGIIKANLCVRFELFLSTQSSPAIRLLEMIEDQMNKKQNELKSLKSEGDNYERLINTLRSEKESLDKKSNKDKKQMIRGAMVQLNHTKNEIQQLLEQKNPREEDYYTSDSESSTSPATASQANRSSPPPSSLKLTAAVVPNENPMAQAAHTAQDGLQARPRKRNKRQDNE